MWCFYKLGEGVLEKNCANALIVYEMFIVCSYLSGSIGIVRKNVTKDAVMVCICIITHYNFFHNNRPGKPLPGHSSFLGLFWALFLWVGMGWRVGTDGTGRRGGWHGRAWCGRFAESY